MNTLHHLLPKIAQDQVEVGDLKQDRNNRQH